MKKKKRNHPLNQGDNPTYVMSQVLGQIQYGKTSMHKTSESAKVIFRKIKGSMGYLKNIRYNSRIKKVEKLLVTALEDGQESLGEDFLKRADEMRKETELYVAGYRKYVKRIVIIDYEYKTNRDITMTPIKNFARVIPKDILEKKRKAEKYFDKFLIVHKDSPNAVKETEEDRIKREKDPIMFGETKDIPDKLFFIGDWIDDYCDLTLNEIIDELDLDKEETELSAKINI